MKYINTYSEKIKQILGLSTSIVGVKFLFSEKEIPSKIEKLTGYRYCQALMKARHGAHVLLNAEGITCPAAAAAFGFKPLPDGLKTGKGLERFGITKEDGTGEKMFEGMTVLQQGILKALYLFPLETATIEPDVVVVEDETEKLMWFALANPNVKGGQRVESSTAILQATCVDATLIPFKDFKPIVESIEYLSHKAIPNSRGKNAFAILKNKEVEKISHNGPIANYNNN